MLIISIIGLSGGILGYCLRQCGLLFVGMMGHSRSRRRVDDEN